MYVLPCRSPALLVLLLVGLAPSAAPWRDCPTPRCDFCLSATVHDAPGIGFDLTTSYGIAVVHFYNGTVLDIAKVPATAAYKALMERLGNAPAPKEPPGRLARWRRWWNKKRGRPATAEAGILASLLTALSEATVAALDDQIDRVDRVDHVAVTRPSMPAFTREDLDDALAHAGLRGWVGDSRGFQPKHVTESQAAFAGNGHGLCPSYADAAKCWRENEALPRGLGLFASMTRHALYASLDAMQEAFPRWQQDGPRVLDFDAGLDALGSSSSSNNNSSRFASEADFWAHVRACLVEVVRQGSQQAQPLKLVLLGGENATDGRFLDALRDALAWTSPPGWPPSIDAAAVADPMFAAARGMALYARRRQEVPGHCMEPPKCSEERERQRRGDGGGGESKEL